MASRYAPAHVIKVCREYDSDISIIWCDKMKAWRFTYQGKPQPSAILHEDGSVARRDLSATEIWDILYQCDEHNKSTDKRQIARSFDSAMRKRVYRKKKAEQHRHEQLSGAITDIHDWSRRNRSKAGDAAKPFVEMSQTKKEMNNA